MPLVPTLLPVHTRVNILRRAIPVDMLYPPVLLLRRVYRIQQTRTWFPSSSPLPLLVFPQFRYVSCCNTSSRGPPISFNPALCRFYAHPPKKRQETKRGRSSLASTCRRRHIYPPCRLTKKRRSLFYCRSRYLAGAQTRRRCPRIPIQDERQQEAPPLSCKGSSLPSQL